MSVNSPSPFEPDPPDGRKRNSVKAIMLMDGRILLTVNKDSTGFFHLLPGGGQKPGEKLTDAMIREVMEETGWTVEPGRLLFVRDYIAANHEFAAEEGDVHQIEFMFLARPLRRSEEEPLIPDPWQVGVEWVELDSLDSVRLYPSVLTSLIPTAVAGNYHGPIYLGDVN